MIVADFASEYGIRLIGASMRWPEFAWLTYGLLQTDTRLARAFTPVTGPTDDPEGGQ